jgi:hypothetical protein
LYFFGASLAEDFSDSLSEKLPQDRRYLPARRGNFHTFEVTCQAVIFNLKLFLNYF